MRSENTASITASQIFKHSANSTKRDDETQKAEYSRARQSIAERSKAGQRVKQSKRREMVVYPFCGRLSHLFLFIPFAKQSRAKQNGTKQSKAEQSKAKQSKAKQSRAK